MKADWIFRFTFTFALSLFPGVRVDVEPIGCGNARRELENENGLEVVTSGNYLALM